MMVNTQPLDRMNYFNGQRLEASDFSLEQAYHMRVRRLLNTALFTYGIASGLEVTVKENDAHRVVVNSGVALDNQGREIVLLGPTEMLVTGLPSLVEGVVLGNYLTIRYTETPVDRLEDGCRAPASGAVQRVAWGGPTRLRSGVALSWQNSWPNEESGLIVLAQAELDESCAVRELRSGVRKYVGTAQPTRALTYALEGEKNIDSENPKKLYFHIRGGRPNAVTLYLRGARFSSLYYTELGKHSHRLELSLDHSAVDPHDHDLDDLVTETGGSHGHKVTADTGPTSNNDAFELRSYDAGDVNLGNKVNMVVSEGDHSHTIVGGSKTAPNGGKSAFSHQVNKDTGDTGQSTEARTGAVYNFPKNLEVWIDGTDVSSEILTRLGWNELGDGSINHDLVQSGTGAIRIDLLGVDLIEGEHDIELRLPSGGGQVIYNLYVE